MSSRFFQHVDHDPPETYVLSKECPLCTQGIQGGGFSDDAPRLFDLTSIEHDH